MGHSLVTARVTVDRIEDARALTVLYLKCSSGRSDLYAPPSRHDLYEGVAESLFETDSKSLKCVFEGPGSLCQ